MLGPQLLVLRLWQETLAAELDSYISKSYTVQEKEMYLSVILRFLKLLYMHYLLLQSLLLSLILHTDKTPIKVDESFT